VCASRPNAVRTCASGACGFACSSGFADCDGVATTGCEANLNSDPAHCGSCSVVCSASHGTPSCAVGSCRISCDRDYGNCDGNVTNGCECTLVNGCDPATLEDLTGRSSVTIQFGSNIGHTYTPRCFKVSAATALVFQGNFKAHPLLGGTYANGIGTPDPSSPITYTRTGSSTTYVITTPGQYPFYCETHLDLSMYGAVFVVP
jgi:plastocyanin